MFEGTKLNFLDQFRLELAKIVEGVSELASNMLDGFGDIVNHSVDGSNGRLLDVVIRFGSHLKKRVNKVIDGFDLSVFGAEVSVRVGNGVLLVDIVGGSVLKEEVFAE